MNRPTATSQGSTRFTRETVGLSIAMGNEGQHCEALRARQRYIEARSLLDETILYGTSYYPIRFLARHAVQHPIDRSNT